VSRLTILSSRNVLLPRRSPLGGGRRKAVARLGVLALAVLFGGCGSTVRSVPPPRPVIIHSGARLRVEQERANEINAWVTREQANIVNDPTFWVVSQPADGDVYPWEDMRISRDTVTVQVPRGRQDPHLVHQIYGHLHLMSRMGRQEEWLPEAPTAEGYELERAILARAADAWILGRAVYNTVPYAPLDELAYAKEAGFLDAFIFTARPSEFAAARAEWVRANPGAMERYRDWFLDTFNREPPGLRPS
jgi:hypothetical protein